MRRFAGFAVAALLLAPAGLRLAAAATGPGAAAILCAIACGHEVTAAACCPMRPERATGPSWTSCSGGGSPGVVTAPAQQPGVVPARLTLTEPGLAPRPLAVGAAFPRTPCLPPPDHVPLLLS